MHRFRPHDCPVHPRVCTPRLPPRQHPRRCELCGATRVRRARSAEKNLPSACFKASGNNVFCTKNEFVCDWQWFETWQRSQKNASPTRELKKKFFFYPVNKKKCSCALFGTPYEHQPPVPSLHPGTARRGGLHREERHVVHAAAHAVRRFRGAHDGVHSADAPALSRCTPRAAHAGVVDRAARKDVSAG